MKRPSPILLPNADRAPRRRIFARSQGGLAVRATNGLTTIDIFGEVGHDGISEAAVRGQLSSAPGDVCVQINSPGGDAFAGVGIYNALIAHPGAVHTVVTGLAASAASIIAMAGDTVEMGQGAHLMIHESWGLTVGNQGDHLAQANVLQKVDAALAGIYAARSGLTIDRCHSMMAAETWLDADEAVDLGFADEKCCGDSAIAARFDLNGVFKNTPAALRGRPSTSTLNARSQDELERVLVERGGLSRGAARKIAAGGWPALTGDHHRDSENLCARLTAAADELRTMRSN